MTDNKSSKEVINQMIGSTWVARVIYVTSVGTSVEINIIEVGSIQSQIIGPSQYFTYSV